MRIVAPLVALSAALIFGLSASAALGQDQPAAGSPPPAATTQAAPDTQAASPDTPQPPADAQSPSPSLAPNPERQARGLAKRLSLTPEQESQIEPILADRLERFQSLRANASITPRDRREQMRGIQQESDRKIEAILSDAQKQQYAQLKAERRAKRQQRLEQQQSEPPTAAN